MTSRIAHALNRLCAIVERHLDTLPPADRKSRLRAFRRLVERVRLRRKGNGKEAQG